MDEAGAGSALTGQPSQAVVLMVRNRQTGNLVPLEWDDDNRAIPIIDVGGAQLPVVDTTAIVKDPADTTKRMRIDVGAVGAGLTRALTMGDRDVNLAAGGTFAESTHTHAAADISSGTLLHERGGLEADVSAYNGFAVIEAGSTVELKSERAQTAAPGAGDDSSKGYTVGSRWLDITANKEYVCLDASAGSAVWTETTQGGTFTGSGTTNTLPKFTGSTALGDSRITDDGTNINFASALSLQLGGEPGDLFAAADTSGADTYLKAQSGGAHTANNPRGADIILEPGKKGSGGSGADGIFTIRKPGGTPGTDDLKYTFDASGCVIRLFNSGRISYQNAIWYVGSEIRAASVTNIVWSSSGSGIGAPDIGMVRDAANVLQFNAGNTTPLLKLGVNGAAPTAFGDAAGAGKDAHWRLQSAFATSGAKGADFIIEPGAGDGAGPAGRLTVRQPGGTPGTDDLQLWHDGTDAILDTFSGEISLKLGGTQAARIKAAGLLLPTKASTGDPTGANGDIYYNSTDGKLRGKQNGTWGDLVGGSGGGPSTVLKTADEWVNNTTTGATLQDDDHLTLPLSASTKYFFKFFLRFVTDSSVPDIKVSVNGPATPTAFWADITYHFNGVTTGGGMVTTYDALGGGGAPNFGAAVDQIIEIRGYIETGSNVTQPLVLRWAQRSASSVKTWVKLGSWMEVTAL